MSEVQPTEITSEESQKQLDSQKSLEGDLLNKIKGGNVFKSVTADFPVEQEEPQEEIPEEQPEEVEEPQEEVQEDEEVVPKSKIQPRIDQLTAKIKTLEQKLAEQETKPAPIDDTQRKLNAMNENELEDTLMQVRVAKEKSRDDEARLMELVKLERQIEKTIVKAPENFNQNQIKEFNNAVQRLAGEGEITDATYPKVMEIAKEIYSQYPKLQKSVDGQAMALELAAKHFKAIGTSTTVKSETQNLKAQVNTLKKRTLLDTKTVKSGGDKINLDKLRATAMTGTMRDKERLAHADPRFKIKAMIPDFLKER